MSRFQPTDAMAVPGLVKRQILKVTRQHPKYQRHSAAAKTLHRIIDGVIENNSYQPVACARGCSWCCYVQTDVHAGEAFVLADAVRAMPKEQREQVVERLRRNVDTVSNLSLGDRVQARVPCAILDTDAGACMVYESRPRACRRWHSLDAEACRVSVETNEGKGNPVDPLILTACDFVGAGYVEAMAEPYGELHQGVLMALEPDSERRFSRGEPVFSGWLKTRDTMTDHEREILRQETEEIVTAANEMSPLGQR